MRDRREEKDGGSFESMKEDACASAYCQNGSVCVDKKGDEKKKKKREGWQAARRMEDDEEVLSAIDRALRRSSAKRHRIPYWIGGPVDLVASSLF